MFSTIINTPNNALASISGGGAVVRFEVISVLFNPSYISTSDSRVTLSNKFHGPKLLCIFSTVTKKKNVAYMSVLLHVMNCFNNHFIASAFLLIYK